MEEGGLKTKMKLSMTKKMNAKMKIATGTGMNRGEAYGRGDEGVV